MGLFYYEKSLKIREDEDVVLRVEYISSGNYGHTSINIPGPNDPPPIKNAAATVIGQGRDLFVGTTAIVSDIINLSKEEDHIRINYSINGERIVSHENLKEDDDTPKIAISLNFSKV